jgi:transitional endoplasmic reticulum ATPase
MNETKSYPKRLQKLLYSKKYDQALKELEGAIADDGNLFANDPSIIEHRRDLWLMRIEILKNIGRQAEALAWICLECDLNPSNIIAAALKNQLKLELNLTHANLYETKINPSKNTDNWPGLAGMHKLKSTLESNVILPILERSLFETYKVNVPNGVLFYGPPGCGKTFVAKNLALRLKRKFYACKPSDFASTYIHGTQERLKKVFEDVSKQGPSVLLLDELDAMAPDRMSGDLNHSYHSEVNELLTQLDRAAQRGILVVGTTNYLEKIDPAVLRPGRFDCKIFVGPPDYEARMEVLQLFMKDRPQEFIDWELLADSTENMSYADIKLLIDNVAKQALPKAELIGMKHFYQILELK